MNKIDKAKIVEISKKNARYGVVLLVFLFAVWYGNFVAKTELEKEKSPKKSKESESSLTQLQESLELLEQDLSVAKFVLDAENPRKIQADVLNSKNGDFYRLIFKAKLDENSEVEKKSDEQSEVAPKEEFFKIKIRSKFGDEKEIGEFSLSEMDGNYREIVFSTEGRYQDVIVEKEARAEEKSLDEDKLSFDHFSITRLDVTSEFQAKSLKQTIFAKRERAEFLADRYAFNKQVNDDFSKPSQKISQYFRAQSSYMTYLEAKMDVVGTGGEGEYLLKISSYDPNTGKKGVRSRINFSAQDLDSIATLDGFNRFGAIVQLEKGKAYAIELDNEGVITDERNYVALENISESSDWSSYFKVVTESNAMVGESGSSFLSNSNIQDLGSNFAFSYQSSSSAEELLNIFEHKGGLNFSREDGMLEGRIEKGNFLTYRINTGYLFEQINLDAQLLNFGDENVAIEYSFDNLKWDGVDGTQKDEKWKDISYQIKSREGSGNVLYLRVFCKEDSSMKSYYGLKDLSVNAVLAKR